MSDDPNQSHNEVTPEATYLNRRLFLKTSIWAGTSLATYGLYRQFRPRPEIANNGGAITALGKSSVPSVVPANERITTFGEIAGYNNYYEFSTDKSEVAERAKDFATDPWSVQVGGLVKEPKNFSMADLFAFEQEERIYRFRCVEGWSMVIPWVGFPLAKLLEAVGLLGNATHVAFETYYDIKQMPNSRYAGIDLPYVEGLRLDEAMHPLTLMATGLYGKTLPNQNGAPIRLVVPWKYGFKSIKSIVKITLTDFEPPTTWNIANSREYGFYSNVNPTVDHPRWSQARERRIGEGGTRETLMFNGYEDQVAHLYDGMDLRKNY